MLCCHILRLLHWFFLENLPSLLLLDYYYCNLIFVCICHILNLVNIMVYPIIRTPLIYDNLRLAVTSYFNFCHMPIQLWIGKFLLKMQCTSVQFYLGWRNEPWIELDCLVIGIYGTQNTWVFCTCKQEVGTQPIPSSSKLHCYTEIVYSNWKWQLLFILFLFCLCCFTQD
jgi:hypothetical protein